MMVNQRESHKQFFFTNLTQDTSSISAVGRGWGVGVGGGGGGGGFFFVCPSLNAG